MSSVHLDLDKGLKTARDELNAANTRLEHGNIAEGVLYLNNLFATLENCQNLVDQLTDEKQTLRIRADLVELYFNGFKLARLFVEDQEFSDFLDREEHKISNIRQRFANNDFETGTVFLDPLMAQILLLLPKVKNILTLTQEKLEKGDLYDAILSQNPLPVFNTSLPCPSLFCNSEMDIELSLVRYESGQYSLKINKGCNECDISESTTIRVPKRIVEEFYYGKRSYKTLIDLLS